MEAFVDSKVGKWFSKVDMTLAEFDAEVALQKSNGRFPVCISVHGVGVASVVAAISQIAKNTCRDSFVPLGQRQFLKSTRESKNMCEHTIFEELRWLWSRERALSMRAVTLLPKSHLSIATCSRLHPFDKPAFRKHSAQQRSGN